MIDTAQSKNSEPINVGAQQVATIYAKALLAAAESGGVTDSVLAEFDAVVSEVLKQHPALGTVLGSSLIKHEEKLGILDRVFGGRLSAMLLNFFKVLSHHGRLDLLRDINRQFHVAYEELRGRVRVSVISAAPLTNELSQSVLAALQGMLGSQPELETQVNPELIGGLVVRVGDTVYDGSVARQLDQAREQMIHRSIHEIQSGRDRFRHSGGD